MNTAYIWVMGEFPKKHSLKVIQDQEWDRKNTVHKGASHKKVQSVTVKVLSLVFVVVEFYITFLFDCSVEKLNPLKGAISAHKKKNKSVNHCIL